MKFHLKKLLLWTTTDATPKTLCFENNMVNIVTGDTSTGKTSIMHIINYCLMTSKPQIPVPKINDTVEWYGIKFSVNHKTFVVARYRPDTSDRPSSNYFFSGIGEEPAFPSANLAEKELKLILEREFGIDDRLVIPYGGRTVKAGSKVSFRYFLLLNTQHEDTIADSHTFFDFKIHDESRYKEAFDRIFDLILGVGGVEKVILQEKYFSLERKLLSLQNKSKAAEKGKTFVDGNVLELLSQAQRHGFIAGGLYTNDMAQKLLEDLVDSVKVDVDSSPLAEVETLQSERRSLLLKIRNLESLLRNTDEYTRLEMRDADSLRPISFITEVYSERVFRTFELKPLIDSLVDNLQIIRKEIESRERFTINIKKEISELKIQSMHLQTEIDSFPLDIEELKKEASKYIFIGEVKTLLRQYKEISTDSKENYSKEIIEVQEELDELSGQLADLQNTRSFKLSELNERINNIKESVKVWLGDYADYRAHFNVRDKVLNLVPPGASVPASNVGSRSNHMFMHLIMILGLHEHAIESQIPQVAPFLILDQPSQPYLPKNEDGKTVHVSGDREKLKHAFQMLNDFIIRMNKRGNDFQVILLEHADEEYWSHLPTFFPVGVFRNGAGLV